jgi:hypothetical protein
MSNEERIQVLSTLLLSTSNYRQRLALAWSIAKAYKELKLEFLNGEITHYEP